MKNTEEFLQANHINPANPNAVRIFKLVEKHPNYEYFFMKSHFGKEAVPIEQIETTFRMIQDKNLKVSKSVDQYVKYVVRVTFEQEVMFKDKKELKTFKSGTDVTEHYRFIHKENRSCVDQRTNFEEFSDEVRDSLIRLAANKIIQQFPAAGKKVVEELKDKEKKEFYFNLNTLLNTNTRYISLKTFTYNDLESGEKKNIIAGSKIESEDFENVPGELKKNFNKITEKPLQAFIKKSARYKSKDALFADLNAALYSLSGDEEYKKTIELIEDTEGAILEGVNHKKGIVVASTINAEAYKRIGGDKTSHCIRNQGTFASYQKIGGKQYLIVNTKLAPTEDMRIIGLTINGTGEITHAHAKSDANIRPNIESILKDWDIRQYVNPMSEDEIIEMLYILIKDESIFSSEDRANLVIKFLPKLDETRFERKQMLQLLKYSKKEEDMLNVIRTSLVQKNSEEFLNNYDYLSNTILKFINDDKQAHEMVMCYVKEFNDTVGLTKEDCMRMLLNQSKYVQPNRLIEIIGKPKFSDYVRAYSVEQESKLLSNLPQLFIYFLRDRPNLTGQEISMLVTALYAYEKRDDIRKVVLKRMKENGDLIKLTKAQWKETSVYEKMMSDDKTLVA